MAIATRDASGVYRVQGPTPVGDPSRLLGRLFALTEGTALVGFDFPIGIPARYAELAGIASFPQLLPQLGEGEWADCYRVCEESSEISLRRPFYPRGSGLKGEHTQAHLFEALQVSDMQSLLRLCDRATATRRAACAIFWTLGGNQVGKAAISGWSEVLAPAIRRGTLPVALWPFEGTLEELVAEPHVVVAETYPAEFYGQLGITLRGSKRQQSAREAVIPSLVGWTNQDGVADRVRLEPSAQEAIESAFGDRADGEDRFDAFIGLLGMLNIVLGRRPAGDPRDGSAQHLCEGWILGQQSDRASEQMFA
jgi:hypothetical protein